LSELETTQLRARNEALTWMLDHIVPKVAEEEYNPDSPFDDPGDQEEN
jgi:hypothetical protein